MKIVFHSIKLKNVNSIKVTLVSMQRYTVKNNLTRHIIMLMI